jgi:hypothetical protein
MKFPIVEKPEIYQKSKVFEDQNFVRALATPNYYRYLTACEASQKNEKDKNDEDRKKI